MSSTDAGAGTPAGAFEVAGLAIRLTAPGVFHCLHWGQRMPSGTLTWLAGQADADSRGRARICFHPDPIDEVQQMLIALTGSAVDRPHRHPHKHETLIPASGTAVYRVFDDVGVLREEVVVGGEGLRYLHTPPGVWHCVVPTSDHFIFWELAKGPFDPRANEYPGWA